MAHDVQNCIGHFVQTWAPLCFGLLLRYQLGFRLPDIDFLLQSLTQLELANKVPRLLSQEQKGVHKLFPLRETLERQDDLLLFLYMRPWLHYDCCLFEVVRQLNGAASRLIAEHFETFFDLCHLALSNV